MYVFMYLCIIRTGSGARGPGDVGRDEAVVVEAGEGGEEGGLPVGAVGRHPLDLQLACTRGAHSNVSICLNICRSVMYQYVST